MSVFDVAGTLIGATGVGAFNAYQTLDFGKKGAAIGALVGVGGYGAGKAIQGEDDSLGGAVAAGAITGTISSAFSTAQELYAFQNPGHVSAMTSMNTTTTATAKTNAINHFLTSKDSLMNKEGWKNRMSGMTAHMMDPTNLMTDVTRYGMVSGDLSKAQGMMMSAFGFDVDEDGAPKIGPDGTPQKRTGSKGAMGLAKNAFGALKQNVTDSLAAAESNSPWFSKEATSINIKPMGPDGRGIVNSIDPETNKPNYLTRTVSLTGKETMGERAAMFIDANKELYDSMFEGFNNMAESGELGNVEGLNRFKDSKDYGDHLRNMDGGAIGTYKELQRAGIYGEDSTKVKKSIGLINESIGGSPLWARTVEKQMKDGVIDKNSLTVPDSNGKIRIKGGGKAGRIAAIVGDTVGLGGAVGGAIGATGWLMSRPFSSDNKVQSNQAYNPI